MPPVTNLNKLTRGVPAVVREITASGDMRRRLMDLGLTPGTPVTPLYRGSFGTLTAYRFRGAVVALRDGDAQGVFAEPVQEGGKNGTDKHIDRGLSAPAGAGTESKHPPDRPGRKPERGEINAL